MHLSANLEGYPFFAKIFLRFSKLPSCRDLYEEHRACSRKSRVEINPLWYRYRAWMIQNGCTLPGKGSREGDLSMRLTYPFSLLFVLFPCFVLVTFVRCCNYFNTVWVCERVCECVWMCVCVTVCVRGDSPLSKRGTANKERREAPYFTLREVGGAPFS